MSRHCRFPLVVLLAALAGGLPLESVGRAQEAGAAWVATGSVPAEEAHQAAAADEASVFAIGSRTIGRYDRRTGRRMGRSMGEATHLNSGFLWQGRLYCAHSNYPAQPEESEIMVLDPESMKLATFHRFAGQDGSLTWAVRHDGAWWCNFAFYGPENHKSYLVRFDAEWREMDRWNYPAALLARLGRYSLSGGIWHDAHLLATGHDEAAIYRLAIPAKGRELELRAVEPAPFSGQGIAADPVTGGLVGIVRKRSVVIFAERKDATGR